MAAFLLACCLSAADPAEMTVRAVDETGLRVEVRRLLSPAEQARFAEGESISARDARRVLVFRLRDAAAPLFGKYKRAGRWLVFAPRRPLVYGHRYAAVAPDGQSSAVLYTAPPRPPTAAPSRRRWWRRCRGRRPARAAAPAPAAGGPARPPTAAPSRRR